MKNKSFFSQIIFLVILSIICLLVTVGLAFIFGASNTTFFDFKNMNFSNMIPILIIGGFISCVIVGITVLFVARSVFLKIKENINKTNENGGGN